MPGILPMKVIKVGTSAQTRIAQACDRCRSKKIRCDGLRPCTQCGNVGFECKTSDKLSRRAFPRGYTESLEERVRVLENEIRELKDLLDEKEEKIDLLSRVYDRSPQRNPASRRPSIAVPSTETNRPPSTTTEAPEIFKLQQPPSLLPGEHTDSVYMGSASGRVLADSFETKLKEKQKPCSDLNVDALFSAVRGRSQRTRITTSPKPTGWTLPSRLLSDQMITVYFQEWAPLFPVIHRPTFLTLYEQYVTNPESIQDKQSLARLNLVFSVAFMSNESRFVGCKEELEELETAWSAALDSFITEQTMVNLQCLVLAQIYYMQKGEVGKLLHYKSLAIGIALRLGLHLSQKQFSLGALAGESRKKVFWTLYSLDCFSAAYLGLPKCIRDEDVQCEYPADIDDEYLNEKGFLPTLPGEYTRLSSALALFKASRILSKVLDCNYATGSSQALSFEIIASLSDELDSWSQQLAPHLKLEFLNGKPSTQVISSRCPLVSMTYHYIQTLIHRPAVCANLGQRASSSIIALAESSKHIIQIIQLLDERKLSFTYCLNKTELILSSGFGVLFQALEVDPEAKLIKDIERCVQTVSDLLYRREASVASEFAKFVSATFTTGDRTKIRSQSVQLRSSGSSNSLQADASSSNSTLETLAARYTLASASPGWSKARNLQNQSRARTSSLTRPTPGPGRRPSSKSAVLDPSRISSESSISPNHRQSVSNARDRKPSKPLAQQRRHQRSSSMSSTNLDYFQFPNESRNDDAQPVAKTIQGGTVKAEGQHDATIWEKLLNTLDETQNEIGDDFYHWSAIDTMKSRVDKGQRSTATVSSSTSSGLATGSDGMWTGDMWPPKLTSVGGVASQKNGSRSVFSVSDESQGSGDDNTVVDAHNATMDQEKAFAELMISHISPPPTGHSPEKNEDFELLRLEIDV